MRIAGVMMICGWIGAVMGFDIGTAVLCVGIGLVAMSLE